MIVGMRTKYLHTLFVLLVTLIVCCLALGVNALPRSHSVAADTEGKSDPSVTCLPLGLYGNITAPPLVDRLSDTGDNLTLVGTTNGLYVVGPGGRLQHFLYSPFGIGDVTVIDDITEDGVREVVVALNDTQVPALRCYDGATRDRLWQFAPMARIWDQQWVDRQLAVTGLEVMTNKEGQSLVITSGRCLYSIDARDGSEEWRFGASSAMGPMVALSHVEGGGGVFASTDDGDLFWLDSRSGATRWHTKQGLRGRTGAVIEHVVNDIAVLDEASGKVVVASADGYAQMYVLPERRLEWGTLAFERTLGDMNYYDQADHLVSLTPDISDDGLPEVLLNEAPGEHPSGYSAHTFGRTTLCDSAGNIVWEKSPLNYSPMGMETGFTDGKPFFLQVGSGEISLIDLKDGQSVLGTVPLGDLANPDTALITRPPGGDGYLAFSSSVDLTALSATGAILWSCPRLGNVTTEEGGFVGDSTADVLFCAEQLGNSPYSYQMSTTTTSKDGIAINETSTGGMPVEEPGVRLLAMMDGATRDIAWSYQVPYEELRDAGGLQRIEVGRDVVGNDQVPDIVGYREDTVFIFNGRTGTLTTVPAGLPISTLEVICRGAAGSALALATSASVGSEDGAAGGLLVVDPAGAPLWATTMGEWLGNESSGSLMALEDINSDDVGDLALVSQSRMVVFRSVAATDNYEEHLTVEAKAGYRVSYAEQVPDVDRDGIPDLACIQQGQPSQLAGQFVPPPAPLLSLRSSADGEKLFEVELPAYWVACDLACGDFNGDGYADSLFVSPSDISSGLRLLLLSGRDGSTLRAHIIETHYYGGPQVGASPAINIGDVDGDGADDLVYTSAPSGEYEYFPEGSSMFTPYEERQVSICAYSPARDEILKSVPATPSLKTGYYGDPPSPLPSDVDGDGHLEVICGVAEPDVPSYDPDAYASFDGSTYDRNLAVVDLDGSRRLAGFVGFNSSTMSIFESHEPGSLGVAASGAVFFLRVNAGMEVTSPENGARTGPTVGVTWEGPADGDFSLVLVDGVRNDMTNGLQSDLYLGRGDHDITVRSVDDWGRISYAPADLGAPLTITVAPTPWRPVWLILSLLALAAIALALSYARLHRAWRARRRAAK